jgi:hypothetical protein
LENITIRDRATRSKRRFTEQHGTFEQLEWRVNVANQRCWLDAGEQKQSVRAIYSVPAADMESETKVRFTMRNADGKHQQYENNASEDVTWYEEVHA